MFGKKKGLGEQVKQAGKKLGSARGEVSKVVEGKKPNKVDKITAGALMLGVANWASVSLFNFDLVQAVAKRKSVPGRAAYGFLGVSAVWAALRGARR